MTDNSIFGDVVEVPVIYEDRLLPYGDLMESLGYKDLKPSDAELELIEQAFRKVRECCRPRFAYRIVRGGISGVKGLNLEGREFEPGGIIVGGLKGSEAFALLVGTIGEEMTAWMHSDEVVSDLMLTFIADSMGSIIADNIVLRGRDYLESLLSEKGLNVTNSYSPGYCGWNVGEQHGFFSLLPHAVCGITLRESGLMMPMKSVSAIAGIGADVRYRPYNCEKCRKPDCYRRFL